MLPNMRRHHQQLTADEAMQILARNTHGILAVAGNDGYPYAVPLSYALSPQGTILFHSAAKGHKIEALRRCSKASFCVVDTDQIVPDEFTTYFRSAIAFGTVRFIDNADEKIAALTALGNKYSPDRAQALSAEIEKGLSVVAVMELTIDHLTGKEAIEFTRMRK